MLVAAGNGQPVLAGRRVLLEIPTTRLAEGSPGHCWRLTAPLGVAYGHLSGMSVRLLSTILMHCLLGGAVGLVVRWGERLVCPGTVAPVSAIRAMTDSGLLPDTEAERSRVSLEWCSWAAVLPRWAPAAWREGLAAMSDKRRAWWKAELAMLLLKGAGNLMRAYLTLTRQRLKGQRPFRVWRKWHTSFPPALAAKAVARTWLEAKLSSHRSAGEWDEWVERDLRVRAVPHTVAAQTLEWKVKATAARLREEARRSELEQRRQAAGAGDLPVHGGGGRVAASHPEVARVLPREEAEVGSVSRERTGRCDVGEVCRVPMSTQRVCDLMHRCRSCGNMAHGLCTTGEGAMTRCLRCVGSQ
jgi:hypothetical protein